MDSDMRTTSVNRISFHKKAKLEGQDAREAGGPVSRLLSEEIRENHESQETRIWGQGGCLTSQLEFLKVLIVSMRKLNIFLLIYSSNVGKDSVDT